MLRRLGALLVTVAALAVLPAPAGADPLPTQLSLTGPATAERNGPVALEARLTGTAGLGVEGATVRLEQQTAAGWQALASGTTTADGSASFTVAFAATTTYRAVFDGTPDHLAATSAPVTVTGVPRRTAITISGTWWVYDEYSRTWTIRWSTPDGRPVPGGTLYVQQYVGAGTWRTLAVRRTGSSGTATFTWRPRSDAWIRAVGATASWWAGAVSPTYTIDNRPPVPPVAYPAAAPRPLPLPAQPHAVGAGANPVITRIPTSVWRTMVGRTWHRGCPVGRTRLRLLRVNYWDYNGYRRRGEIVLNRRVVGRAAGALTEMYKYRYPIRAMYRVDRFGWSRALHGGNDTASMAHGNTSGFNCRGVVGNPGVRSPHSTGRAIDVNTWENPYVSRRGIVPDTWWYHHSHPRIAWRSASHPVVQIWRRHGFRWTYGVADSQHWDGRSGAPLEGGFVVG